jgi:hypothetical protein
MARRDPDDADEDGRIGQHTHGLTDARIGHVAAEERFGPHHAGRCQTEHPQRQHQPRHRPHRAVPHHAGDDRDRGHRWHGGDDRLRQTCRRRDESCERQTDRCYDGA